MLYSNLLFVLALPLARTGVETNISNHQDRFRVFGWPVGVNVDMLTEPQGWSLIGESIAIYSLATVMVPLLFTANDASLWSVVSSCSIPRCISSPVEQTERMQAEHKVRAIVKRRRIGGI